MEHRLAQLMSRWNILRIFATTQLAATYLLLLLLTPSNWWTVVTPVLIFGGITAALAAVQLRVVWAWLTLVLQVFLFGVGLFAIVSGIIGEENVPILLLAFTMLILGEHILSLIMKYAGQFSRPENLLGFNLLALSSSLHQLYRKLARDCLIFSGGFLFSLGVAAVVTVGPVGFLSDPSLYAILAAISLALLVVLKEE